MRISVNNTTVKHLASKFLVIKAIMANTVRVVFGSPGINIQGAAKNETTPKMRLFGNA